MRITRGLIPFPLQLARMFSRSRAATLSLVPLFLTEGRCEITALPELPIPLPCLGSREAGRYGGVAASRQASGGERSASVAASPKAVPDPKRRTLK